ncbi:MAG TPA: hypothetical protein VF742_16590 [Terracidiphilus sp.]
MWDRVLQMLAASCRHRHISQPFSAVSTSGHSSGHTEWEAIIGGASGHYVVCLDCGKHFVYDWAQMRVMK